MSDASLNHPDQGGLPEEKPARGRQATGGAAGALAQWKVVLHHDEANCVSDVMQCVMTVARLGKDQSINSVLEARRSGKAVLLTTHRERAELYERQFARWNVTVSLERQ